MASLLDKARVLIVGNLHELLNKAIDLNSIAAVKQHVRDLENATQQLGGSVAVHTGKIAMIERDIASKNAQIETAEADIALFLNDGDDSNDHHAITIEARIMGYEDAVATLEEELVAVTATRDDLDRAHKSVFDKLGKMRREVGKLERMKRAADAKSKAAKAVRQMNTLAQKGAGVSIDNVSSRIREDAARADAELAMAMGEITSDADDAAKLARAKQRLEERKKRLQAQV